jgi:hypothetical protein
MAKTKELIVVAEKSGLLLTESMAPNKREGMSSFSVEESK